MLGVRRLIIDAVNPNAKVCRESDDYSKASKAKEIVALSKSCKVISWTVSDKYISSTAD